MRKDYLFLNEQVGDRILSVNEQDVRNATQEETINLIKNAGCTLQLVLQSFDFANVCSLLYVRLVETKSFFQLGFRNYIEQGCIFSVPKATKSELRHTACEKGKRS